MTFDAILDAINLAYRQKMAVYAVIDFFKTFLSDFSIKKVISGIMVIFEMFTSLIFDSPVTPRGPELDLSDYELVFCDDFEGKELDTDVWQYRSSGSRRGGFNAASQVRLLDGNLILTGEYLENGEFGKGWYTGMINLKKNYLRGYYEIRCKCSKDVGFWSAFWIQSPDNNPYSHEESQGGVMGAEIDIFESMSADMKMKFARNSVTQTVHCNGFDDDVENIDSRCLGTFYVGNDIYDEFNTYGLEWTEDEYIFYINGVESGHTSFGKGVSTVPEQVIVSLEIPDNIAELFDTDHSTHMTVDYVKIYEKK